MAFRTKIFLIFITTVGITCGLLFWLNQRRAEKITFQLIQEKVLAIAASTAPLVHGDTHEKLNTAAQNNSPEYRAIRDPLRAVRDANQTGELKVTFIYTIRPTDTPDHYTFVVDAEEEGEDKSQIGDEVEYDEDAEIPKLNQAHVDSNFATDSFGTWLTAYAPIKNSTGDHVALLGVDIEADAVIAKISTLRKKGWIALVFSLILATIAAHFLSRLISAPLMQLESHVQKISEGDLASRIKIDTEDEFGRLENALNAMSAGLQERETLKGALVRYVSSQAVDSVIENDLDAESQRRVTVLTASLVGIKDITHSVPPDRIYSLLNDWFSTTIDIVLTHRGTIEQSGNDAVSALFGAPLQDSVQERNAVETGLDMMRGMKRLRKTWQIDDEIPLALNVAIHTGTISITQFDKGNQQIDSQSLTEIGTTAAAILKASEETLPGIIISEETATGLRGTIPLGEVEKVTTSAGEINVMTVEMPI